MVNSIAYGGAANDNTTTLDTVDAKNLITLSGSYSENDSASNNTFSLTDSKLVFRYDEETRNESVFIVNTGNNEANNNTVSITNHTELAELSELIGSMSESGPVMGNTLTISDSILSNETNEDGFLVRGSLGETEAANNNLYITNSTLSGLQLLYGASGYSDVYNNTEVLTNVTITGRHGILGNEAGNYAHDNAFSIIGGSFSFIDGDGVIAGTYGWQQTTQNTLTLSKANISGVIGIGGGMSDVTATDNTVTISDTTISNSEYDGGTILVAGGSSGYTATAGDDETKTILPSADDNSIRIDGGSVDVSRIYGGWLRNEDSKNDVEGTTDSNTVIMGDGVTASTVIGGNNELGGSSSKNAVTINGGTIKENVIAGETLAGDANGNTLDIYGGEIGTTNAVDDTGNDLADGNLIAGGYTKDGAANENTVSIYAGTLGNMMSLYGGYSKTESTDNTLNLYTKGNTVENLGYFQTLNFYVPENTNAGETMLEVTGNADVHGAAINAGVYSTTQLSPGQVINLIHDGNQPINTDNTTYSVMAGKNIVTDGAFLQREVFIKKQDANTIVLYVPEDSKPIISDDTKIISTQQAGAASTVSSGSDIAATDGLEAALTAWKEEHDAAMLRTTENAAADTLGVMTSAVATPMLARSAVSHPLMAAAAPATPMVSEAPMVAPAASAAPSAGASASTGTAWQPNAPAAWLEEHDVEAKFTPYVMLGGHNLRYNTSSTIDTNGFNGELGFVKRSFQKKYADTIMPFLEYGTGNYTSWKNGSRGDGSQHYVGAGILVRRDMNNGFHYEGLIRAGRMSGDYGGRIAGYRMSYNSSSPYIAAHVGLGKIYKDDTNEYNVYGKFFWSHLNGDTVTLHSELGDAQYDLEHVDSLRTRLGFRWTKHLDRDVTTVYAGIGWDYEFDGKAKARYQDYTTPDASMKGSSEFLELGWQSKSTKENPWGAEIRVTGWTGMKQGFTYSATITRKI